MLDHFCFNHCHQTMLDLFPILIWLLFLFCFWPPAPLLLCVTGGLCLFFWTRSGLIIISFFFLKHCLLVVMLGQVVSCFIVLFPPGLLTSCSVDRLFIVFIAFFCPGWLALIILLYFLFPVPLPSSEVDCFGTGQGWLYIFSLLGRIFIDFYSSRPSPESKSMFSAFCSSI